MGQVGVAVLDRARQRIHHLVLDLVGEVAAADRGRQLTPRILYLLVLGEGIGDQREQADIFAEALAEGLGRILADHGVRLRHPAHDIARRNFAAGHLEPHTGHGLIEQAGPGAAPGDRLFV